MAPEKTTEKLVYIYKIKCFQIDLCLHDLSGKNIYQFTTLWDGLYRG